MTDAIAVPLPSLEALESRLPASAGSDPAVPLYLVGAPDRLPDVEGVSGTLLGAWAATSGFEAKPGQLLVVPHPQTGDRAAVLVGSEMGDDGKAMPGMGLGALPGLLPKGTYHLQTPLGDAELSLSAYLLGGYRYSLASSRGDADAGVCLICDAPERERVLKRAQGSLFGRDLINTPANRLGPDALTLSA
ncbi:MAG: hypothetical protein KI785_16070, partial [Devosiaceae bacterium]|nr:hypothetical protein [Devosiaceae bacterium MH13]